LSSFQLYESIAESSEMDLSSGNINIDKYLLPNSEDKRLGVSLIIPIDINNPKLGTVLNAFESLEPNQFYYPLTDYHVTVFDFVKGNEKYCQNYELEKLFIAIVVFVLI
jgi:hypothetical protein